MLAIIPELKNFENNGDKINIKDINIIGCVSENIKEELEQFIRQNTEYSVGIDGYNFNFEIVENDKDNEWYSIDAQDNCMTISGNCEEGLYRAIQTIKQLISQPFCRCRIDVARYFYPVEDLKKIIDYISLFKFNYLHLHLTDDQGWRFESKKYPELTRKGSVRSHTNFNLIKEKGFYTQEQLKDIVDYCHKKFIKVIPEIDLPGHTMSALACYPELSCFDRKLKVATHWGVKFDIMCAGKDFTYEFCRNILDELCEIFTDEYVHIGGDEVPKKRWLLCDNCKRKIEELGLQNMEQLQIYFANTLAAYLKAKNKKVIMWDIEFKENDLISSDKEIILQFWGRKTDNQILTKLDAGRQVISSNSSAYYIDLPYGYITLDDSYNTDIIPDGKKVNIYGLETCLWTEYVKDIKKAKFNMFPRILGISEIFWTGEDRRDYKRLLNKLPFAEKYLMQFDIKMTKKNVYNPNKLRAFFSKLWFERRQLAWQGIYLNVDNFLLNNKVKKKKK